MIRVKGPGPDNLRSRHELAGVSVRMFGGVKKQAEHRGRQRSTPDRPREREIRVISRPEDLDGRIDCALR